jgi:hypothetical protein
MTTRSRCAQSLKIRTDGDKHVDRCPRRSIGPNPLAVRPCRVRCRRNTVSLVAVGLVTAGLVGLAAVTWILCLALSSRHTANPQAEGQVALASTSLIVDAEPGLDFVQVKPS